MDDNFTTRDFKKLLNELVKRRFPTETPRPALAEKIKLTETMVQRYFRGLGLGAPSKGFQKTLGYLFKDESPSRTAFVLAAYLEFVLKKTGGTNSPELQTAVTYLKELAASNDTSQSSNLLKGQTPDLARFPEDFYPLLVVCGDRRERPQKDWSDLFASSMSPLDLTFLVRLGLRPKTIQGDGTAETTLIYSDRPFACSSEIQLKKIFSRANLLVVGSPKVNLLARDVNFSSLFRFSLKRTWKARALHQRLKKQELLCQANLVQAFGIMCRTSPHRPLAESQRQKLGLSRKQVDQLLKLGEELLGQMTIGEAAEMFYPTGISDPVKRDHRTRGSDSRRVGLVSLASHPFDPNRVCILAAGIDGVGTAHCLKSLAHAKKAFAKHPLGGVLTVTYNDHSHEPQQATYTVEDPIYTPDVIIDSFREIISAKQKGASQPTDFHEPWSEQDAQEAIELVKHFFREQS